MQITSLTKTNQNIIDEIRLLYQLVNTFSFEITFPHKLTEVEILDLFDFLIANKILCYKGYNTTQIFKSYNTLDFPYGEVWLNPAYSGSTVFIINAEKSFLRMIMGNEYAGASVWYTLTGKTPS